MIVRATTVNSFLANRGPAPVGSRERGVRMRKKMIEKIEKKTGVAGPTWASWSDHEIKKLYVYMMVSGPIYLEDADLIGK